MCSCATEGVYEIVLIHVLLDGSTERNCTVAYTVFCHSGTFSAILEISKLSETRLIFIILLLNL